MLIYNFCRIAALAARLADRPAEMYLKQAEEQKRLVLSTYINENGCCRIQKQTAVAMLIYYEVYEALEPLKQQLKNLVEQASFHHDCGMVGLRRLYMALNRCGLEEYAYRILTAKGYPGYREWFDQGAVTLWETWDWQDHHDSKNHQMYSDFMSWMVKTILGIQEDPEIPGFKKIRVEPYFFKELDNAEGSCETNAGTVAVSWKKEENGMVRVEMEIPEGICAYHKGRLLPAGKSTFLEKA